MYRQLEKIVKQQYLCHMSTQYGKLRSTNSLDRFGCLETPQISLGFASCLCYCRVVAHRRPTKLYDVWLSPGMVHYIYIFGALAPWRNFARCKIHFMSKSCVFLYCQRYCAALQQRVSAKRCIVVQGMELRNFRRGRHLPLSQIFPTTDCLAASGLTPRTSRPDHFF